MSTSLPSNVYLDPALRRTPSLLNKRVVSVIVVGTPTSNGDFYHFRLSLVTEAGDAIRLDPTIHLKSKTDPLITILVIEYKHYMASHTPGTEPFHIPATASYMATEICGLLVHVHKVNQYNFDEKGRGCRHWCAVVLDKLAQSRIVQYDVSTLYRQWEVSQHLKLGSKVPMPRICGTFYT
ncbi:hypothetical protein F5890DRAFT_1577 [Lentinula detonsa]|uniref:DUF7770 domain-containing protein n=1 Tax=Lentinula detonsa TaxID=2804962 RepID=A0AA38UYV7_9AGAR|nr:hypothetical protein F5890DRAFT_1577 [Lentinula detonsa]